jgi:predicted amino acid-binding ACT domain protein
MKRKIIRDLIPLALYILVPLICLQETSGYCITPDCMNIQVKDISYQGRSTYKITIVLTNMSRSKVSLRDFRKEFSAQAEKLGQWIKLTDYQNDSSIDAENSALQPGQELNLESFVKIQSSLPSLYLNGFGEINLKFSYALSIFCGEKTDAISQSGEDLFWITPESGKWTLREGM